MAASQLRKERLAAADAVLRAAMPPALREPPGYKTLVFAPSCPCAPPVFFVVPPASPPWLVQHLLDLLVAGLEGSAPAVAAPPPAGLSFLEVSESLTGAALAAEHGAGSGGARATADVGINAEESAIAAASVASLVSDLHDHALRVVGQDAGGVTHAAEALARAPVSAAEAASITRAHLSRVFQAVGLDAGEAIPLHVPFTAAELNASAVRLGALARAVGDLVLKVKAREAASAPGVLAVPAAVASGRRLLALSHARRAAAVINVARVRAYAAQLKADAAASERAAEELIRSRAIMWRERTEAAAFSGVIAAEERVLQARHLFDAAADVMSKVGSRQEHLLELESKADAEMSSGVSDAVTAAKIKQEQLRSEADSLLEKIRGLIMEPSASSSVTPSTSESSSQTPTPSPSPVPSLTPSPSPIPMSSGPAAPIAPPQVPPPPPLPADGAAAVQRFTDASSASSLLGWGTWGASPAADAARPAAAAAPGILLETGSGAPPATPTTPSSSAAKLQADVMKREATLQARKATLDAKLREVELKQKAASDQLQALTEKLKAQQADYEKSRAQLEKDAAAARAAQTAATAKTVAASKLQEDAAAKKLLELQSSVSAMVASAQSEGQNAIALAKTASEAAVADLRKEAQKQKAEIQAQLDAELAASRKDFAAHKKNLLADLDSQLSQEVARRNAEISLARASLLEKKAVLDSEMSTLEKKRHDAESNAGALAADASLAQRLQNAVKSKAADLTAKQAELTAFSADLDARIVAAQQKFEAGLDEIKRNHRGMIAKLNEAEAAAALDLKASSDARVRAVGQQLSTAAAGIETTYAAQVQRSLATTRSSIEASRKQEADALAHLQTLRATLTAEETAAREASAKTLDHDRVALQAARQALAARIASAQADKAKLDADAVVATTKVKMAAKSAISEAHDAGASAVLAARKAAEAAVAILRVRLVVERHTVARMP